MPPSSTRVSLMLGTLMMARSSSNSFMSCVLGRKIFTFTFVPGSPRSFLTASSSARPSVPSPLISTILSPESSPARNAGVSSIGAITVRTSSLTPMVMPRPPNLPAVSSFIAVKASSSMNWLCGSRDCSMPFKAP